MTRPNENMKRGGGRLKHGLRALGFAAFLPMALLAPSAAQAQEGEEFNPFEDDWFAAGVGVIYGPEYSGSDDSEVSVGGVVAGRVGGFNVAPRVGGVAVDLIRDDTNQTTFTLGPVIRARFDRSSSDIKNDVVDQLEDKDVAVEAGIAAGVEFKQVLHDYDQLGLGLDLRWDIAGAHKGMVVSPSVTYMTALSRGALLMAIVSADYFDDDANEYYWSVDQPDSLASGLPIFEADDGFNSVSFSAITVVDLDGNLLNGGFNIAGGVAYSRLTGDAKDSPITSLEGDADNFYFGAGVGYIF